MEKNRPNVDPVVLDNAKALCRIRVQGPDMRGEGELAAAESVLADWRARLPPSLPGPKLRSMKCDG